MRYQQEFFERSADLWPGRIAVDDHGERVTYGDLEARANRIGALLRGLGVGPNERVCVFTAKGADAYAAVLGVLKAGGAWVPLSTAFPVERLRSLIAAIRPRAIIVDSSTVGALEAAGPGAAAVVGLGAREPKAGQLGEPHIEAMGTERPSREGASPEDLAYIIFTSGSTGTPKGVMVQHRNTASFLEACADFFAIPECSRFAHYSELTFDPSIFDLFHCWQTGGTVVPVNRRAYRVNPARFFLEQSVNVVFTVPRVIEALRESGELGSTALAGIRHLLFTGEPVRPDLIAAWYGAYPESVLYNMYGTTETAIVSHWCVLPKAYPPGARVPVGRVLPGMRVYLMKGDRLVSPGETGECVVYGAQLSPGYWGSPFQTDAVFVPNPFDRDLPQKVYRTGDQLALGEDGLYYFAGRDDAMVKVRGHRVELPEVEGQLRLHDDVLDAVVVRVNGQRGANDEHLVAFIRLAGSRRPDVLGYLRERLPTYMVPARIVPVEQDFPRNANGKVDREACERWAGEILKDHATQ